MSMGRNTRPTSDGSIWLGLSSSWTLRTGSVVPSLPQTHPRFQLISNAGRHPSGNLPCSSRQSSQLFPSCLLRAPNKYVPWRGQGDSRRTGTEMTSFLFFLLKRASLSNLLGKIQGVNAKLVQSYLTLCDPVDLSPPGSSVHESSQARILEWVGISSSRGSSWPRDRTLISCKSPTLACRFFTTEPQG